MGIKKGPREIFPRAFGFLELELQLQLELELLF